MFRYCLKPLQSIRLRGYYCFMKCVVCSKPLQGRQTRFCSRVCARTDWKRRNPAKQRAYIYKSLNTKRTARREKLRELKNQPCEDCGISYPYYVMEFDHIRGIKKGHLSLVSNFSDSEFLEEILKCDVVCANCHRERT